MGEHAVKIARTVNYTGAGTARVSRIKHQSRYYFLEMNTRLQVEHPVTELVTGIDLVREQFVVASGQPLSFKQSDIQWLGHAIECRVYAEDPGTTFLLHRERSLICASPDGPGVRVDVSRVFVGSFHLLRSMIAKLVVWDELASGHRASEASFR